MSLEILRKILAQSIIVALFVVYSFAPYLIHPRFYGVSANQIQNSLIAQKSDEFRITNEVVFDDMKARLDSFYDGLKQVPNAKAYAIFYRGRRHSTRYYPLQIKNYLSLRGFPASRITGIWGGYREEPMLELWIVPQGAAAPKPTPTVFPKKRRRR